MPAATADSEEKVDKGKKTKKNPLAVNESAPLEIVIFDGGFGTKYAEDAKKIYEKNFPKAKVKFSSTQKIQSVLQPRFNQGTPPDLIDNSGAEQMDMGVLVGKKQLSDLTPLLDAPSVDDPNKKVRDTLRPGIVEMGQFDGDPVWIMYYAYTVYGVWYSQKALDSLDATYPETWDDMLAVCEKAKKKGIAGWTYAGKYPYYIPFSLYPMIAKVGGVEVLDAIDNLEPNAWKHPAVKTCFEAYYELYKKGYILKGTPGLDHIQSQTAWTEGKALFIPNGSWVENEAAKTMPKDFDLAVSAPTGIDSSDKMPFGTIWASGGEPFIVPAKAKNADGGMEQLRIMLSEASSKNFTDSRQVADRVQRRHRRHRADPGSEVRCRGPGEGGRQRGQPAHPGLVRGAAEGEDRCRRPRRDDGGAAHPGRGHQEDPGLRRRGGQGRQHPALQAPVSAGRELRAVTGAPPRGETASRSAASTAAPAGRSGR